MARTSAAPVDDVCDEVALSVVGGDDGDLGGRDAHQPQVHVGGHDELGLRQVLHVVRQRRRLANALKAKVWRRNDS